ncbi:MAG: DNA primase [Bacillota bacterium]|nr:DNA primase [Bacillota bacterium]
MANSYNSIIEEIKSRCNIVDVISSVVPLKRAGSNYKGICPFHNEKTPSFIVSEAKQIFTCFGCGATGDVIEFTKRYYNLGFSEAVEKLAHQYGIELSNYYENKGPNKEPYYEANKQAAHFFFDQMKKTGNAGYKYMIGRKFTPQTIQKFGIGFADDEWHSLIDFLKSKGVTENQMIEISLASKNDKGRVYDRFRNRVIFPIINTRGKVIGFGGRIIGDGDPKYLNSSESLIFQKKYNLFGLNLSRPEIQQEGYAIVVEGYMDVAALYQEGIKNVVASCGTALTEQQATLLKRYTDKVILCYDADAAGIKAAIRGIDILRAAGLEVKVLHVDDGKDPDEYVKKNGADAFKKLIKEKAIGDIDYKILLIRKKYDINDTSQSVKFLQATAGVLRSLSPVEADLYIKKIAKEVGISEGALRREVEGKSVDPKITPILVKQEETKAASAAQVLLEKTLIRLALIKGDYFDKVKAYSESFELSESIKIVSVLDSLYKPDTEFDLEKLKENLDDPELIFLNELLNEIKLGEDDEKAFNDCIEKIDNQKKEKRKKEIIAILDMADDDTDSAAINKLMEELKDLQHK